MKVRKAARYALRNRWTPTLAEVVFKAIRKHMPSMVANITRNNAFLALLTDLG